MIHLLPEHIVNQIAAGEVVERPASIVKELVENSLDAGSTHIAIHLRNGGKSLIRISDNGYGIASADLPVAVLRHATSKIEHVEDLDHIQTLGFRGEALASIAAVSQTYIESKTVDSLSAAAITIDHGTVTSQTPAARVQGTTVNIENLFANVPARRKFLKSDRQELAAILRLMQEIALAYPQVHFEVFHNGQELINTPARNTLLERFYDLFPAPDLRNNLLPIEAIEGPLQLTGVISSPVVKRSNRAQQMLAVNGRSIKDYRLSKVIEDAYHGFLLSSERPLFFIHLKIAPEEVDVNVHPRKTEVRFGNIDPIMSFLYRSVKSMLETKTFSVTPKQLQLNSELGVRNSEYDLSVDPKYKNFPQPMREQGTELNSDFRVQSSEFIKVQEPTKQYDFSQLFPEQESPKPIRVLSQLSNSYILCTTDKSLLLFDQHAAHERFIYEYLKKHLTEKSTQNLLTPLEIDVNPEQSTLLAEQQNNYADFGISLEQASPTIWFITAVPNMPKSQEIDWVNVVLNTLENLHSESLAHSLEDHRDDLLHTMACKAAVKFNDKLSLPELQKLVDDIAYLAGIYTCPHGRPFRLELTFSQLDRYFKRH